MVKLWRSWLQFLDENKCGNFQVTVPSTAFNTWRYRFNSHKIYIHANELALKLERDSYKGGRTEVFFQGRAPEDTYYYLDVNNLYGFILQENKFPTNFLGAVETNSLTILERRLDKYAVTADVSLDVNDNYFPMRYDNHTCYPLGKFRTTLTTPELLLSLERGWLVGVHALSWYTQEELFRDYVSYFYSKRLEYNAAGQTDFATICKLLINSLYGKFGQKGMKQVQIGICDKGIIGKQTVYSLETGERRIQIHLSGKVWEQRTTGEAYNSFPAIAAHVTALARLHMTKIIKSVTTGHVYYTDTDSLIVDKQGYKELEYLIDLTQLGKLKVELSSNDLTIRAPKDYSMGERNRIKGVSKKAIELSEGVYQQEQWIRLSGLLRSGTVSRYTVKDIIKRQRRTIFSGTVLPSGWVVPLVFPLP